MGVTLGRPRGRPRKQEVVEIRKLERFIRIVEIPMQKNDAFKGYQPEIIWVDKDQVVRRKLVDKPNLFEFAFSNAADAIDPRNESLPYEN